MTAPSLKERAILMSRGGLSNDVISGVLGISLEDVEALMVQAEPNVELPDGTTDLPLFQTRVDLTYDDMRLLPTTPVELLPEPPEGGLWLPFWAFAQLGEEGDFGGWDNTDAEVTLLMVDGSSNGRRLSPTDTGVIDDFFISGGGLLFVPESFARLPGGAYPPNQSIRSAVQALDAASLDGSVVLRTLGQSADFEPIDEGGYPDARMRVTVAYSLIDKLP